MSETRCLLESPSQLRNRVFTRTALGFKREISIHEEDGNTELKVMHLKRKICEDDELSTFDDVGKNPGELSVFEEGKLFSTGRRLTDEDLVVDANRDEHKTFVVLREGVGFRESFAGYLLRFHHPWKKALFYCISTIIGYIILFAGAQAKFYIPGVNDKIPYTLQTFVVLLVPTFLGAPGFISVLAYVITGAVGFPVFAGLTSGVSGATAGFLIGFCIAAAFIAIMVHMGKCRTVFTITFTMLSASGMILSAGWIGYSKFIHWDWSTAFRQAVLPFLVSELLKVIMAIVVLAIAWRLMVFLVNRRLNQRFDWKCIVTGLY